MQKQIVSAIRSLFLQSRQYDVYLVVDTFIVKTKKYRHESVSILSLELLAGLEPATC